MARTRMKAAVLLSAYDEALEAFVWRGTHKPDDVPKIEVRYYAARERMIQHLMET